MEILFKQDHLSEKIKLYDCSLEITITIKVYAVVL